MTTPSSPMLLDVGYFWINAARVRHMGNAYRPIKETIIGFTRGLMAFAFRDVDLSCLGLLCTAIGLATGNFENARGLFANLSDHQLLAVYSGAFSVLTYTLMGITLLAVMVCFMTLRKVQIAFNSGVSK